MDATRPTTLYVLLSSSQCNVDILAASFSVMRCVHITLPDFISTNLIRVIQSSWSGWLWSDSVRRGCGQSERSMGRATHVKPTVNRATSLVTRRRQVRPSIQWACSDWSQPRRTESLRWNEVSWDEV